MDRPYCTSNFSWVFKGMHAFFWFCASPFVCSAFFPETFTDHSGLISDAIFSGNSLWMPSGRISLPPPRGSHGAYKFNIFNMALIIMRLSSYICVFPSYWKMQSYNFNNFNNQHVQSVYMKQVDVTATWLGNV